MSLRIKISKIFFKAKKKLRTYRNPHDEMSIVILRLSRVYWNNSPRIEWTYIYSSTAFPSILRNILVALVGRFC